MSVRRTNDFVVGLVVIVATVVIVAAALWAQRADFGQRRSPVEARFRDVGNAQVGGAVVVRGVSSGRIEGIELADDGWVVMRLKLDDGVKLPPDPVVLLGQASLFGEWQATITERSALPPNPDLRRQVTEASGHGDMLPGGSLPDVAQLTAVAGRIAGDVASLADRVQTAFDDSAARELRSSIHDVAVMSSVLAATVREQSRNLNEITAEVSDGVGALSSAAATVQRVAERVDSSTASGQVRSVVDNAAVAAAELREAAGELRRLSGGLARTQGRLDSLLASSQGVAAKLDSGTGSLGLLINDPSLFRQTDSLVRELRTLVQDFQLNPKRYVGLRIF